MKRILIYMLLITYSELYSQGLYNNGAKIVVSSGAYLNIVGTSGGYLNTTNATDGAISLDGTLKVEGNIVNNAAVSDLISTSTPSGKVMLSGTTAQTVSGTSTAAMVLPNLTINNLAGVVLNKDVTVNGITTFTSGLLNIGSNNFTFGATGTVSGTPTAANMIVATGTGQVRKLLTSNGSFSFPIGDNNVSAKYSPVSLNFTTGTFAAGAYVAVNVVNAAYVDPYVKTSYLKRYWNLSQTGITAFSSNANFTYDATDVVGTESQITSTRISPTPIVAYSLANTTLHQMTANNLTSFGTFSGVLNQLDNTLNLKLFLESLYNGGGLMLQAQGATGNQFTGTTADQITLELHSAVAGQYAPVVYSVANVNLSTSGLATIVIPAAYNGTYYLTIKNRNSIATVSAIPVSFAGGVVDYDFSTASSKAFGSNMKNVGGVSVIWGGDVNGDDIVDTSDMIMVDNGSTSILFGYNPADINGDGIVDTSDMIIVDNNSTSIVMAQLPL